MRCLSKLFRATRRTSSRSCVNAHALAREFASDARTNATRGYEGLQHTSLRLVLPKRRLIRNHRSHESRDTWPQFRSALKTVRVQPCNGRQQQETPRHAIRARLCRADVTPVSHPAATG